MMLTDIVAGATLKFLIIGKIVLSEFHIESYLNLITDLWAKYYHTHFTD